MADDYTQLNAGSGGDVMDETGVTFNSVPNTRKRPRVVIAGENPADLAEVINSAPDGTEFGIIVRNLVGQEHPGSAFWQWNAATLVPSGYDTSVATYTVPANKRLFVTQWCVCGDVNAKYTFVFQSSVVAAIRTSPADLSSSFAFNVMRPIVNAGQTVVIKVNHGVSGIQANFDATILGYLIDV